MKISYFAVTLKQLSSTTIELSTIIPTPSVNAESVIILREYPITLIMIRAARIDVGIELPTIREALISPKNRKMITMDMMIAKTILSFSKPEFCVIRSI